MLRQKIDTLIHQIHNLRVEVVCGRRTRNKRCRCSWHKNLIEIRLAGRHGNAHVVLWIWKNLAHGSYRNVNFTGRWIFEVTNIVEVRHTLKEKSVGGAGATSMI